MPNSNNDETLKKIIAWFLGIGITLFSFIGSVLINKISDMSTDIKTLLVHDATNTEQIKSLGASVSELKANGMVSSNSIEELQQAFMLYALKPDDIKVQREHFLKRRGI